MKRWLLCMGVFFICMNSSLSAGGAFRGKQRVESSDEGVNNSVVSQALIEGNKLKILIEESSNPMIPKGAYFLSTGGDITYFVNPMAKTIARIDRAETEKLESQAGRMAEQNRQMGMKTEMADIKLEQKLDESGPTMLGMPTRHYRYTLSYSEKQHAPGLKSPMTTKVEEQHEFWATNALTDEAAMIAWQKDRLMESGDASDAAVQQAANRIYSHGFILKHVINTKSSVSMPGMGMMMGMGGGTDTDRTTREITDFRRESVPASVFELPKGYTETEFFSPGGSDMPDLNAFPSIGGPQGNPGQNMRGMPTFGDDD